MKGSYHPKDPETIKRIKVYKDTHPYENIIKKPLE